MNVFTVLLPMPPSVNSLFATDFRTKRRFISKDYAAWKRTAASIVIATWKAQGSPAFDKHIALTVHLGVNYRSDLDGRIKAIADILVQTIPGFPDDRYIDRLEIERVQEIDGARIMVSQIAPPDQRLSVS